MSTISDGRSRWLARMLAVLGGSALLSACSPASPSAPEAVAALGGSEPGGTVSAQVSDLWWCRIRECNLIDPGEVTGGTDPHVQVFLNIANVGNETPGTVHVAGTLIGADGRRISVSDTDLEAPLPGETVHFIVKFVVPSTTPSGRYHVEMALSGEFSGLTKVWVSDDVITVVGP
jgi:hypothetical protein